MVRLAASMIVGALIAACSGSNRVDEVVPRWVNPPPPRAGTPQHETRGKQRGVPTPVNQRIVETVWAIAKGTVTSSRETLDRVCEGD